MGHTLDVLQATRYRSVKTLELQDAKRHLSISSTHNDRQQMKWNWNFRDSRLADH
jgi:hypothetical protein